MHMLLRLFWFLLVFITAAAGPWWLLAFVGVPYLVHFAGVELLAIALLVDGYFGYERTGWPLYTLVTLIAIVAVRFLRPYISVYNR
jgi:hypothetical protein